MPPGVGGDRRLGLGEFRYDMAPFVNELIQQSQGYAEQVVAMTIAAAVDGATAATSKQLLEIARVFREGLKPAELRQIHQEVGLKAQRAVVQSFRASRNGQNRGASGYRTGGEFPRYAGGKLLAALNSENFFEASADGLDFINVGLLNKQAAQWARLNFGAGARGRGSRRSFDVNFSNLVIVSLGLNEGPRPGFRMPRGYFWKDGAPSQPQNPSGNPGAEFYVAGTGPRKGKTRVRGASESGGFNALLGPKMTRGIEARNFLDAGVAVIARELPRRYLGLVNDMYRNGESAVRAAPVNIRVKTTAAYRRSSTTGL